METFQKSSQFERILKLYEKNEDDILKYVLILREWMKKQPHLPSDLLSDDFLKISLIQNKLSVEKTKQKLEYYCTFKSMNRYQYLFERALPSNEPMIYMPLPVLTDNAHRIIYGKLIDEDAYDIVRDFNISFITQEICSRFDYNDGIIFAIDYTNMTATFITKMRANVIMDGLNMLLKGYSARIKEIHLFSKLASRLFTVVKPFLPSKIASRVFIHDNLKAMQKIAPAKCLPSDFDGELKTLNELRSDFDKFVVDHSAEIVQFINTKSVEHLRMDGPITNDMQGTFMKLNID